MKPTDFEQYLLRSADGDRPSAEQRRRNRAATMKVAGLTAAEAASVTAAASGAPSTAAAKTVKVAAGKTMTLAKLVAFTTFGLASTGAVLTTLRSRTDASDAPTAPTGPTATVVAASASLREPPSTPSATAAASNLVRSPPAETRGELDARRRSNVRAATPRSGSADPLALETELLEAARTCIDDGDVTCAAAKLDEHRARFPRGALVSEAGLLQIELARKKGDNVEALRLANELLRASPSGPYARRARELASELNSQTGD